MQRLLGKRNIYERGIGEACVKLFKDRREFLESYYSGVARLEQPRPLVPTGTQRLSLRFPRVIKE